MADAFDEAMGATPAYDQAPPSWESVHEAVGAGPGGPNVMQEGAGAGGTSTSTSTSTTSSTASPLTVWTEISSPGSPQGDAYFYNTVTGESSWTRPPEMEISGSHGVNVSAGQAQPAGGALPAMPGITSDIMAQMQAQQAQMGFTSDQMAHMQAQQAQMMSSMSPQLQQMMAAMQPGATGAPFQPFTSDQMAQMQAQQARMMSSMSPQLQQMMAAMQPGATGAPFQPGKGAPTFATTTTTTTPSRSAGQKQGCCTIL